LLSSDVPFATHYFELTLLDKDIPEVSNLHFDAEEFEDELVFLHHARPGPADKSYGIQVAGLAGLPQSVIKKARIRLETLEQKRYHSDVATIDSFSKQKVEQQSMSPTDETANFISKKIQQCDPDAMTAREALELLYSLRSTFDK